MHKAIRLIPSTRDCFGREKNMINFLSWQCPACSLQMQLSCTYLCDSIDTNIEWITHNIIWYEYSPYYEQKVPFSHNVQYYHIASCSHNTIHTVQYHCCKYGGREGGREGGSGSRLSINTVMLTSILSPLPSYIS